MKDFMVFVWILVFGAALTVTACAPPQIGPPGPAGQSITGAAGINGTNGVDASGVTMVQFCPGYTTTYPSVFPEFATCVSGSLYAVYWDGKNAWQAEVVPGLYESTSTSAPCNFKVGFNCSVTLE